MKRILFHLGHPAHFHLFKNVITALKEDGYSVDILIKKKDILESLLQNAGFEYLNILPDGRKDSKLGIAYGQLLQDVKMLFFCIRKRPSLLVGTSVAISHVGKLLGIPSINVNEDDAEAVPLYAKLAYPWATHIVAPHVCSVGKWSEKKIAYSGYHELSYLHPENFLPSEEVARKYVNTDEKYFVIRFAKLGAHHDVGVKGLSDDIALKLVKMLSSHGRIYITSERPLSSAYEKYRLDVNPLDMHHVMAFATMYIGDSQTMAAEAGVLGIPFVRFNDFVGRIGYLKELEEKYMLGFGVKPTNVTRFFEVVQELLVMSELKATFQKRKERMLKDKINLATFLTNLIVNYKQ